MPLLKSLFCFKGYDNGRRYLSVSLGCYFFLILLSGVLAKAPVLIVLLLLVCTPVMLATSMRRIHDAGLATPLAAIPVIIYWLCVFGITYLDHGSKWALLILAALTSLALTTIRQPNRRPQAQYVFGYSGPVNLGQKETQAVAANYQRIEPTIASHKPDGLHESVDVSASIDERERIGQQSTSSLDNSSGWESKLQFWIVQNKNLSIGLAALSVVIVLLVIVWPILFQATKEPLVEENQTDVIKPKQRLAKIEMPDNFWVMMDENEALTIAWQGDLKKDGEIWSAITGKGDKTCVDIAFNGRVNFRTMLVSTKNQGDYYADFSPVDTAAIIDAIARRSNFKLCGYDFSLKGTQAKFMVNRTYSKYLEN